jgi:hypothetical protein
MVASFPLALPEFFDRLPIRDIRFFLPEAIEVSRTAGGDVIRDSIGTRLWQGEITLGRLLRSEAQDAEALIDLAMGAEASFMVYPLARPAPQSDPSGGILGVSSPQIRTLSSDARVLSLKGLPPSYELRRGDYLSFQYRSNPTRFALHRVQETSVVASAIGQTNLFEVRPHIRPGAVIDAAVQLVKPACKVIILPDGGEPGRTSRFITDGMSFSFMQTLR